MAYRVLIPSQWWPNREPLFPASNWMSEADAHQFSRDWQAQFPDMPVKVVCGRASVAFSYEGVRR